VMVAEELGLLVTDAKGAIIDGSSNDAPSAVIIGWPEVHAGLIEAMNA